MNSAALSWHRWSLRICFGIRCHLPEIIINKTQCLSTSIHQSSLRHSKASGSRWWSVWVRGICPSCWTTQTGAACGFVWYLTVHIAEMILMLSDILWFLKLCSNSYSLCGRVEILQLGLKELKDLLTLGNVGGKLHQSLRERRQGVSKQKHIFKRLHVFSKSAVVCFEWQWVTS